MIRNSLKVLLVAISSLYLFYFIIFYHKAWSLGNVLYLSNYSHSQIVFHGFDNSSEGIILRPSKKLLSYDWSDIAAVTDRNVNTTFVVTNQDNKFFSGVTDLYDYNRSANKEQDGKGATIQNVFTSERHFLKIHKPDRENGGLNNAESKQTISTLQHSDFTCQGRQLDEMEEIFHVPEVNCRKLLSGDRDEVVNAQNFTKTINRSLLSEQFYLNLTTNCELFQRQRGYIMCPLTSEEENFPIAFSMLVYKDVEMVERLLRSIYRPQNYYCIHVDQKSKEQFMKAVLAIADCFENVFLAPERVNVKWGQFSVLEPELICMKHLWKYRKWKYFINLTGQEFPLKTNWELVQILTSYNGANDVSSTVKRANKERWRTSPPHNLTPVKGSVHIAVNRELVDYILHNQTSKDLLDWVKTTRVPDETFFATLNHNPKLGIKGSYKGIPESDPPTSMLKPFFTRFKNWVGAFPCAGRYVRTICILTTDLPLLYKARHMFANKFYLREDPIVIGCLEEMIFNNTRDVFKGDKQFNSTYYSQLGFVLNQVI